MPNLTDVLNTEDEQTVEELALQVCIGRDGSNVMDVGKSIGFQVTDLNPAGFEWTAPNGDWVDTVVHGTGRVLTFDGDTRFLIAENALPISATVNGFYMDGGRLVPSNPSGITGAGVITNTVYMTTVDYNAIVTKDPTTLYVLNG